MKRLSKMAYELRDVTIFFKKRLLDVPSKLLAYKHKRSVSRINQIVKIQDDKFLNYIFIRARTIFQTNLLTANQSMQHYYHHEIGLILQRYYIRMKND